MGNEQECSTRSPTKGQLSIEEQLSTVIVDNKIGETVIAYIYYNEDTSYDGGNYGIVTIDEKSGHISFRAIPGYFEEHLKKAFDELQRWYRKNGHIMKNVIFEDPESCEMMKGTSTELLCTSIIGNEIKYEEIILKAKQNIERSRSILNGIQLYSLPRKLWPLFMQSAIEDMNSQPVFIDGVPTTATDVVTNYIGTEDDYMNIGEGVVYQDHKTPLELRIYKNGIYMGPSRSLHGLSVIYDPISNNATIGRVLSTLTDYPKVWKYDRITMDYDINRKI